MHAASRHALETVRAASHEALGPKAGSKALSAVAGELYQVAALLAGEPRLRRTLADPATDDEGRVQFARALFDGKLSDQVSSIVLAAVGARWSASWDFTDALEIAGDDALLAAAESDGVLDTVEDELFRLERILAGQGEVVGLLDEQSVPAPRRLGLLDDLIEGKVTPITKALLEHAVTSRRKTSVLLALDDLLEEAARRRERSLARVVAASELTGEQVDRLAVALGELYGRPITVRADVDPTLRGGLYIRVGDEVIDGSVTHRLAQLRTAFAG